MSRRYTLSRKCQHEGCREFSHYSYDTKRAYSEGYQRYNGVPWYCNRHDPNGHNLSPHVAERCIETRYTATPSAYPNPHDPYWAKDGAEHGTRGFIYGDGWNAYSEDFPMGTVIVVETRIRVVLPEGGSQT